jgi:hypothetical protein
MKKFICLAVALLTVCINHVCNAEPGSGDEAQITLTTPSGEIFGTLTMPKTAGPTAAVPVALIIAGSGPTDRDGNNPVMKNNCLKLLAEALAQNGIASVRYDKRGIAASKASAKNEADLRFENYIEDAKAWIQKLRQDKRFSTITVIGHSEGSLIGMVAAKTADKFVSVAGAGEPADEILKTQLQAKPKAVQDLCFPIIDRLKSGQTVADVDPALYSLFRPSVQPYMISWFKYDPQTEIKKLTIPSLIIQGTGDIQVSVEDGRRLAAANPRAQLVLIEQMNHIFRIVAGDRAANVATYNNPSLPIADKLIKSISDFILKN